MNPTTQRSAASKPQDILSSLSKMGIKLGPNDKLSFQLEMYSG